VAPEAVPGTAAVQLLPACVQLSDCAEQAAGGGTAQDAAAGALQLPLLQEKLALPVAGDTVSVAMAEAPEAVVASAAEQLCPPTVQLMLCAAQAGGGGTAQLALLGAPQTPALQLKLAVPVAGSIASRAAALAPELVLGKLALQLWAPSTHVATCAGQAAAGGAAHEAWLAALQVPLLQVKLAAPVKGRAASVAITGLPEAVS
jgi:hypothetical protein